MMFIQCTPSGSRLSGILGLPSGRPNLCGRRVEWSCGGAGVVSGVAAAGDGPHLRRSKGLRARSRRGGREVVADGRGGPEGQLRGRSPPPSAGVLAAALPQMSYSLLPT